MRDRHPEGYSARGAAVGIFWAFTPLIPFQMYLLGLTWVVLRKNHRLDFHPLIAMAWVLVTNALTMVPVYFLFFLTGQLMLGRWGDLIGYQGFQEIWLVVSEGHGGLYGAMRVIADVLIGPYGAALFIGCLPYAMGGAWLGYTISLRLSRRTTERRRRQVNKRPHL